MASAISNAKQSRNPTEGMGRRGGAAAARREAEEVASVRGGVLPCGRPCASSALVDGETRPGRPGGGRNRRRASSSHDRRPALKVSETGEKGVCRTSSAARRRPIQRQRRGPRVKVRPTPALGDRAACGRKWPVVARAGADVDAIFAQKVLKQATRKPRP
jgi:hypothetical protein